MLLDVYRSEAPGGWPKAGDRPGPRRRLDPRLARRAGHPAAEPPRRQRLGRLQRRLPAQPAGDDARARDRREAGDRVGPREPRGAGRRSRSASASPAARRAATCARSPRSPPATTHCSPASRTPTPRLPRRCPSTASTTCSTPSAATSAACASGCWRRSSSRPTVRPIPTPSARSPPPTASTPAPRRSSSSTASTTRWWPSADARAFAERLEQVSENPVLYVELPGSEHAFDLAPSLRTARVVEGIERFLRTVVTPQTTRTLVSDRVST